MKDLRFTGSIDGDVIDVTLRTDMINDDDHSFNIAQVQVGDEFGAGAVQSDIFQKHFASTFSLTNSTVSIAKDFATSNGLDLAISNSDGSGKDYVVDDDSVSNSL